MKRAGISSATLGLYMEDICRFSTVKWNVVSIIRFPFGFMSLNVIFKMMDMKKYIVSICLGMYSYLPAPIGRCTTEDDRGGRKSVQP
ncbi:MAG: hypothetical protein ACLU30_12765 [Odoribacter splanchnicus]